jgi:hypothetical protein
VVLLKRLKSRLNIGQMLTCQRIYERRYHRAPLSNELLEGFVSGENRIAGEARARAAAVSGPWHTVHFAL